MELSNSKQMNCFFFLQNEPPVGSSMELEVTLPQELAGPVSVKMLCRGKVVEVEKAKANGKTGVVCTVEDYRLIPLAADADDPKSKVEERAK